MSGECLCGGTGGDCWCDWGSAPITKLATLFSTGKDSWETPDGLFDTYNGLFHFVLDAAADSTNHKCPAWLGPGGLHDEALSIDWGPWLKQGNIWLNPPYSRGLQSRFVRKAQAEVAAANAWHRVESNASDMFTPYPGNVVCLLPARTDTKLFHEVILPNSDPIFLKGRVKFVGAFQGAPFPSMIVVF